MLCKSIAGLDNTSRTIRNGNSAPCANCRKPIKAKRTGRTPRFCSTRCRDAHRRQLNFDFFGCTTHREGKPRNTSNSSTISANCKGVFASRGSVDSALWKRVFKIEVIDGFDWISIASSDGVKSYVRRSVP